MDIVLNSLASSLGRCLEQRSHIYIEATVGITSSYNLSTTVVTILTHLGDEDTRTTTFLLCELISQLACQLEVAIVL